MNSSPSTAAGPEFRLIARNALDGTYTLTTPAATTAVSADSPVM